MNKSIYKYSGFNFFGIKHCLYGVHLWSTRKLNPLNKLHKPMNNEINTGFFYFNDLMYIKRNVFL